MKSGENLSEREARRIESLKKYEILDTPPDGSFDHVVKLAAHLLDVPISIISLVDTDRIWFKSSVGVGAIQQIDRVPGLCASAILSDDLYVIENAGQDPRSIANPLVAGEMGFRFYAAAPLKVREGFNLGTLCIIDRKPRILTEKEKIILKELADIVIDQLELRLEARLANNNQHNLLGIIAHELKNSITTVPLYAEMIKENSTGQEENLKLLQHIINASDKTRHLIEDMLEIAKLRASEFRLEKKEVDISSVVGRVVARNLVLANAKQQQLFLEMEDNIVLNGDENKIAEIADNLINNAIKYSPKGGKIEINVKALADMAVLEVVDEGPGFNHDDQDKLFTPFTRLSARPTGGEQSTGMGLAVVKMLAEAHGGSVLARNHTDRCGAVFRVEIPV